MTSQNLERFFFAIIESLKTRVDDDRGAGVFISIYNGGRCCISSSITPWRYFDNPQSAAEYLIKEWVPNDTSKEIKHPV